MQEDARLMSSSLAIDRFGMTTRLCDFIHSPEIPEGLVEQIHLSLEFPTRWETWRQNEEGNIGYWWGNKWKPALRRQSWAGGGEVQREKAEVLALMGVRGLEDLESHGWWTPIGVWWCWPVQSSWWKGHIKDLEGEHIRGKTMCMCHGGTGSCSVMDKQRAGCQRWKGLWDRRKR
jgi:hypothetical protein